MMASAQYVTNCVHRVHNDARGGNMDMPLWYWQLCFGVLMIVLMVSHEFD